MGLNNLVYNIRFLIRLESVVGSIPFDFDELKYIKKAKNTHGKINVEALIYIYIW